MTMESQGSVTAPARRISAATMAKISPPPPPEEVFADWLLALPHDACLETAAANEIARIDQRNLLHPGVQQLRLLLVAVAGKASWTRAVANR
jgi:hypothetical protein